MNFAKPLIILIVIAVMLELSFRILVPACNLPNVVFDEHYQLLRYENDPQEGMYSLGTVVLERAPWRINNYGWMSEVDYKVDRKKPLVAIIGDSYIDAFHVGVNANVSYYIRELMRDNYEVYGFGMGGAGLSHYVQIARYVNDVFNPDILVFNVGYSDVIESLQNKAGFQTIRKDDGWFVEREVTAYRPSKLRRLLKHSALIRYVTFNRLQFQRDVLKVSKLKKTVASQNQDYERLCDYLLGLIKQDFPKKEIVFLFDAPRSISFYSGEMTDPAAYKPLKILENACVKYGFHYVDLIKPMIENYQKHDQKFEFKFNSHWNKYGHRVAAETLSSFILRNHL